jgi:hypothetical protein
MRLENTEKEMLTIEAPMIPSEMSGFSWDILQGCFFLSEIYSGCVVLLLGIFRRAPHPSDTRGHPAPQKKIFKKFKKKNLLVPAPSGSHLKCLKCVKTYEKTFY